MKIFNFIIQFIFALLGTLIMATFTSINDVVTATKGTMLIVFVLTGSIIANRMISLIEEMKE